MSDALIGVGVIKLPINLSALLHALIHPSAWKVNSTNFALTGFSEVQFPHRPNQASRRAATKRSPSQRS